MAIPTNPANGILGLCLACALLQPALAHATTILTLDSGYGLADTRMLRLNFAVADNWRMPQEAGWYWSRSWEANVSYWYLYKVKEGVESMLELGLTPNLRLEHEQPPDWGRPYFEMGLGVHLLSERQIGTRPLGSYFHFGTHVGFGVRLGGHEQFDLAWRIEHISNAGLHEPNPGINFTMLRLGYRW